MAEKPCRDRDLPNAPGTSRPARRFPSKLCRCMNMCYSRVVLRTDMSVDAGLKTENRDFPKPDDIVSMT
jgi:hypothetical protein